MDVMGQAAEEDGVFEVEVEVGHTEDLMGDHMVGEDLMLGVDLTDLTEDAAHLHSPAQVAHLILVQ